MVLFQAPIFFLSAKFGHCSMRQSKERAANVLHHARRHIGSEKWKISFYSCEGMTKIRNQLYSGLQLIR